MPPAHAQIKSDERVEKLTEDIAKLTGLMAETGRFINRLAHIAEAHEQQ